MGPAAAQPTAPCSNRSHLRKYQPRVSQATPTTLEITSYSFMPFSCEMGFSHSNDMEDGVLSTDAGRSLSTENLTTAMSSLILTLLLRSFCPHYQRTYPFSLKHLIQIQLFNYEHNIYTVCPTSGSVHYCTVDLLQNWVNTKLYAH